MDFANTETELLWEKLLTFADNVTGEAVYDFNYSYVNHLIDELSTRNDLSPEMVIEQFQQSDYGSYRAIFMATLLGRLKNKEIIPTLVDWLGHKGDLETEIAVEALIHIGGTDSIPFIKENFFKKDISYRLFAMDVLRKLKIPESQQAVLDLLEQEKDDLTTITSIANGLCELVSTEGIPLVKKIIDDDYYDDTYLNSENHYIVLA